MAVPIGIVLSVSVDNNTVLVQTVGGDEAIPAGQLVMINENGYVVACTDKMQIIDTSIKVCENINRQLFWQFDGDGTNNSTTVYRTNLWKQVFLSII